MSGGSYNHLYRMSSSELIENAYHVWEMRDRISKIPNSEKVVEQYDKMLSLIDEHRKVHQQILDISNSLFSISKSVELHDSGDGDFETVKKSLDEYNGREKLVK